MVGVRVTIARSHACPINGGQGTCQHCKLVRYRDVDPPQWSRFDPMRGQGTYLDRDDIARELGIS